MSSGINELSKDIFDGYGGCRPWGMKANGREGYFGY